MCAQRGMSRPAATNQSKESKDPLMQGLNLIVLYFYPIKQAVLCLMSCEETVFPPPITTLLQ